MRILIMILLALSLSATACSKKKNSGVIATPPVTDTDDDDNNDDDLYDDDDDDDCTSVCDDLDIPDPDNGTYFVGKVTGVNTTKYKQFLKMALGYEFYSDYHLGYNYSCDAQLVYWIFQVNYGCGSTGISQFSAYINDIGSSPSIVTVEFTGDGFAEGYWLVDAYKLSGGYLDYYMAIPFSGEVSELSDGRLVIEAGPLTLVSVSASNKMKFNVKFNDSTFGTTTLL